MDFITQSARSLWSSASSSEVLPVLARSTLNAVLNGREFRIPRAFSQEFIKEYALYLANSALAAYSFRMLASKNISMLSFIPSI